jgi:hypothetical protein
VDELLPKLAWFPLYVTQILGSAAWLQMKDYQRGWYIQLLLLATQSDHPGYLPLDGSLWRLAGAHAKEYFDKESPVVLACFKRRQMDGQEWIYNEQFLLMLQQQTAKIRTREEKKVGKGCRKPGAEENLPLFSSTDLAVSSEVLGNTANELFMYYCELFCRDSRYTLTDSRRHVCELRLQECMRENGGDIRAAQDTARTAIFNLSRSNFHLDHGHFDWTDHIFKTREVFEKRVGMKITAKPLQPGTRAGVYAQPGDGHDEILPDWLSDFASKTEAERQTLLSQLQRERDPVKSA